MRNIVKMCVIKKNIGRYSCSSMTCKLEVCKLT